MTEGRRPASRSGLSGADRARGGDGSRGGHADLRPRAAAAAAHRLAYVPVNHAFPQFGLAATLMYLPAKFRIRLLEPVDLSGYAAEDADNIALVQGLAEDIRARIQGELEQLLLDRRSVWLG